MTALAKTPPVIRTLAAARSNFFAPDDSVYYVASLVGAVLLGAFVRAFHVLSFDFPVNDGGLFYSMTRDVQDSGFSLPAFTSYNGGEIPFGYPPLGFYAAALADDLTPLGLLDVFRFLPLVVACLTVPAFYLLARSMLRSKVAVVVAVLAFALIPRSFIWLVMGGGVTRAFGLLFAILALHQAYRLFAEKKQSAAIWLSVFCSLTVLSHLETGWFLAFSVAIFFVAFARDREGARYSVIVAAGTVLLTAPWWGTTLARHGMEPFLAATGTGGSILSGGDASKDALLGIFKFVSTSEPLFPLWGVLGFIGAVVAIVSRRFLLPAWWALIIVLDVRAFPTFTTLPVALLAGVAASEVLLPAARQQLPQLFEGLAGGRVELSRLCRRPLIAPAALAIGLLAFATVGALLRGRGLNGEGEYLRGLSEGERDAMAWVASSTPSGSRFLIIPSSSWETASDAEWFPVLADRKSVTTVQGSEWLDNGAFEHTREAYDQAFECGYRASSCLTEFAVDTGISYSHVYVSKQNGEQCCYTLLDSLLKDPSYELLYDGEGATIFAARLFTEPDAPQVGQH